MFFHGVVTVPLAGDGPSWITLAIKAAGPHRSIDVSEVRQTHIVLGISMSSGYSAFWKALTHHGPI